MRNMGSVPNYQRNQKLLAGKKKKDIEKAIKILQIFFE